MRSALEASRQEDLPALLAGQDRDWEILARAQYNEAVTDGFSELDNMALMGVISFGLLEAAFHPGASGWQVARSADTVLVGDVRSGSRSAQTGVPEVVSRLSTA